MAWKNILDSVNHFFDNTSSGLTAGTTQDAIDELADEKAPLASPTLTGTPTAPTAAVSTNTTQIATTAFVIANAGSGGVAPVTLSGLSSIYVSAEHDYTITNYNSFSTYSVSVDVGSVSRVDEVITVTAPSSGTPQVLTVTKDGTDTVFSITILPVGVQTPTNVTPTNGSTDKGESEELTADAFQWLGESDTHASSDWQIATDSGFSNIIDSTTADVSNLTTWTPTGIVVSQTYYWRVKYTGDANGTSEWSTATSYTTKVSFFSHADIKIAGEQAFGVGNYPDTLPTDFTAMSSFDDIAHANYGNYQYSDGSILVFIPKFFYRIGDASSPNYATYGANAIDIVGIDSFANEAAANTGGYAIHRAFIDGGSEKHGFFIDKYLCSKNGTTSGKSIANASPISLTTSANYTESSAMTGCTGILADAVVLSRARGAGFNNASIFMYSAMALLSLAHAQASNNTTHCGWYDATNNFPKGCNSSLADVNDASVTFTTAGDSDANKPLAGSANTLNKTTHNGQDCGVTDINGAIRQVVLGVTNAGTSATDTTAASNGDSYVLKSSIALSSLTSGFGGATDAWGTDANLANNYDAVSGLFPWGSTTGQVYFGSGTNQVFSNDQSGTNWLQTGCGIQDTTNGADATGTSQFGSDGCYQYNRANQYPTTAGYWGDSSSAGAFYRYWGYFRSDGSYVNGFRAAAYGN